MKKFYQGVLFFAMILVALYGLGEAESGGSVFNAFFGMGVIAVLMDKAGMMDRRIFKKQKARSWERH